MSKPLPVIDLLNNVIAINNYLRATQMAKLAPSISGNPSYAQLVQDFNQWQYQIWDEYFTGLIDGNLTTQPTQIATLYSLKIADQDEVKTVLFRSGGPVPGVVSLCDDVSSLIQQGNTFVTQLDDIAKSIEGADQAKVDALQAQADALQAEFNQQEDKLTDDSIDSAFDVVSCAIDVAVAVGSEGDAIQPLVKGVTKIAKDAVDELVLTDAINSTLLNLESAWAALDEASAELALVTMNVNQLNAVVVSTSAALTALNAVVTDWSTIADTATESAADWTSSGDQAMNEWSARMIKVAFTTATQTIATPTAHAAQVLRTSRFGSELKSKKLVRRG